MKNIQIYIYVLASLLTLANDALDKAVAWSNFDKEIKKTYFAPLMFACLDKNNSQ